MELCKGYRGMMLKRKPSSAKIAGMTHPRALIGTVDTQSAMAWRGVQGRMYPNHEESGSRVYLDPKSK